MITRHHFEQSPPGIRGSALIISLIMLLVLTIIGVTALSNVTIEERMARGFEHGERAFQGSESAITLAVEVSSPQGIAGYTASGDLLTTAINRATCADGQVQNGTPTTASYDVDPDNNFNTSLTANVAVIYLGEGNPPPGFSLGGDKFKSQNFQVSATTTVGATQIQSSQDQGLEIVMMGAGGCKYMGPP